VEGVVEERIGRLEDELRQLLKTASVEGESFTVEILASLAEISERDLLKTLSGELEKRHQLVTEGEVQKVGRKWVSHYNFSHALFQQYLYNDLGRREKMMLHGDVAKLIEQLYEGQHELITDVIGIQAEQWMQDNPIARSAEQSTLAGVSYFGQYAPLQSNLPGARPALSARNEPQARA
jgi:predicted ATPase